MRILSVKLHRALLIVSILTLFSVDTAAQTKPGCRSSCGNLTNIPFPFGISQANDSCSSAELSGSLFKIDCSSTDQQGNPLPYWSSPESQIIVKDISLKKHEITVMLFVASDCYNASGPTNSISPNLNTVRFPISTTKNKFTAVGCDTNAIFSGNRSNGYSMGCMSLCNSIDDVTNGSCSGIGCCQTSVPRNVMQYNLSLTSYYNHAKILDFNPCSYSFVAENGFFNFSTQSLFSMPEEVPVVLDWTIGNQTCEEAQKNMTTYMCRSDNSYCSDATNGKGYRCNCSNGYQGNPYLPDGCLNINECMSTLNPCTMTCIDLPGTVNCSCPSGFLGNGWNIVEENKGKNATGCSSIYKKTNYAARDGVLAVCGSIGALLLLVCTNWLYQAIKKRNQKKLKEKFFKRNGGLLLQQQLSSSEGSIERVGKLFNSKELEKATDNFSINRILGEGGQGTVYKGMLMDGRIVAVKKSISLDEANVGQFINEVSILSQINHRNVVGLLGCCLETEIPLLVYEYIPNGSLYHFLHNPNEEFPILWEMRLKIAIEVAGALSYLHYAAAIPIFHRDIKTANILLDEKFCAKIADFGASKTVALDQTHVTTMVQGTFGYLDPEYFQTGQFTDKSDVYSFGVVLVELLTGHKAVSSVETFEGRGLAMNFIISLKEDRLFDIVDARVLSQAKKEEILAVAEIAGRCLNLKGKKRPSMKEVTTELESIRKLQYEVDDNQEEGKRKNIRVEGIEGLEEFEADNCSISNTDETSLLYSRSFSGYTNTF